jgi:hypothetical protein
MAPLQEPRQVARDLSLLVHYLLLGKSFSDCANVAVSHGQPRIGRTLHKAAVAALTLEDPSSSWDELGSAQVQFQGLLREQGSIFDNILPYCISLPSRAGAIRLQTSILRGANVAEAQAKPIFNLYFGSPIAARKESTCTVVLSDELLKKHPQHRLFDRARAYQRRPRRNRHRSNRDLNGWHRYHAGKRCW